jgi:hypothetical protein
MARKRTLTDVSLAKTLAAEALGSDSGYQDALNTPLAEATDPLYRDVITLHDSLTPPQRKVLAAFARQGFIDGVSTVLGILDGSSQLGRHGFVDLDLTLRGVRKKLNGSLQDSFLEAIELTERPRTRRAKGSGLT